LEIFLVIFIFGDLGGIVGMILAIPGYTLIRIIAREFLGQFRVVQTITSRMKMDAKE
jgi:predicted PurR-regulated permease PerM